MNKKSTKVLTPEKWISKIQGRDRLNTIKDEGVDFDQVTRLMLWYGEYIEKKTKKLLIAKKQTI